MAEPAAGGGKSVRGPARREEPPLATLPAAAAAPVERFYSPPVLRLGMTDAPDPRATMAGDSFPRLPGALLVALLVVLLVLYVLVVG
jgi:hypothetical protein